MRSARRGAGSARCPARAAAPAEPFRGCAAARSACRRGPARRRAPRPRRAGRRQRPAPPRFRVSVRRGRLSWHLAHGKGRPAWAARFAQSRCFSCGSLDVAVRDEADLGPGSTVHFSDVPLEPVAFAGETGVEAGFKGKGGGGLYEVGGSLMALLSSVFGSAFATPRSILVVIVARPRFHLLPVGLGGGPWCPCCCGGGGGFAGRSGGGGGGL